MLRVPNKREEFMENNNNQNKKKQCSYGFLIRKKNLIKYYNFHDVCNLVFFIILPIVVVDLVGTIGQVFVKSKLRM